MLLSKIIENIQSEIQIQNFFDYDIKGIESDSRIIQESFMFVGIVGLSVDGAKFAKSVVEKGVKVVLVSDKSIIDSLPSDITIIRHISPIKALGDLLNIFYSKKPKYNLGITGTNGKTSVAHYLKCILQDTCGNSVSIGTLGMQSEVHNIPRENTLTMFEPVNLHRNLNLLSKEYNVEYAVYECTSQGIDQNRLTGINLDVAAFINISPDHMNYHKTMENYLDCKLKTFTSTLKIGGTAVLNSDMKEFEYIKSKCKERKQNIITFGRSGDVKLINVKVEDGIQNIQFNYNNKDYFFQTNIIGSFQAMNLLCAFAMTKAINPEVKNESITKSMEKVVTPEGRMDLAGVKSNGGRVYIDYACVPDSMELALKSMREFLRPKGKLIVVFGCGGDRTAEKRPVMGKIASEFADIQIVTDDNPRTEDPGKIRAEIIAGCPNAIEEKTHRKFAIAKAIELLGKDDIAVLLNKGHERYIIGAEGKEPFNEFEIVKNELKKY